jgi:hypothetical protein
MEEKPNPLKELFDELFTLLENLETQNSAVLQFLKDQKVGTDKKLAPYLERAGNASSVKWRAARVRMEYLLSPIEKKEKEQEKEKAQEQDKEKEKNKAQEQDTAKAQEQDKDKDRGTDQDKNTDKDQNQAQATRKGPNKMSESAKPEQGKDSGQKDKAGNKQDSGSGTTEGQSKAKDNQKRK